MPKDRRIKVLVVDDSALMRKKLKDMIDSDPDLVVIGTARDGEDGVLKARELRPNVVTMDINMPGIDGLTALQYIMTEDICPVVIVSSLSQEGALITFEALELGAFDYVPKPGGTISLNVEAIRREIIEKVKAAGTTGTLSRIKRKAATITKRAVEKKAFSKCAINTGEVRRAVTIGISTGGPKTIMDVLPAFPSDLGTPVFLVQHMPPTFTSSFAGRLNQNCVLQVKEAESGEIVQNNVVYLAKGGQHLLLRKNNNGKISIRLSTVPEHLFVPSVSVMMESVFGIFGSNTLGVLMTGMGDDGADMMVKIKQSGGYTIAESEETAIVWGMPREAIEKGGASIVLPSYAIAGELVKYLKSNR